MNNRIKYFRFLYLFISLLIFVSCEKAVFTGTEVVEAKYQNGKIFVASNPAKAQIYIDGKNSGLTTPDTIKWLNTANYKLTLKLDLFKDTSLTVHAEDKLLSKLMIDYTLNPNNYGKIVCTSIPNNVNVFLNGKPTNKQTPVTLTNLFPGNYSVIYQKEGTRADSMQLTVRGGTASYVSLILEDTTKWVTYSRKNSGIFSDLISAVAVDKKNVKWIGTKDNGLISFDGVKFKQYSESNSQLISNMINTISFDAQDNLWIGTSVGLMVKKGESWIDMTAGLPSKNISSFAFDKNGNTWIGTSAGLVKYNGSSYTVYSTGNSGINGNTVTGVAVDKAGNIWVSSDYNGICKFNGSTWVNYTMANMGFSYNLGNAVRTIVADIDGAIWAAHIPNPKQGEYGGFTKFDGARWNVIDINGLPTQSIYSIYVDQSNYKWIGTNEGIGKFLQPANLLRFNSSNNSILLQAVTGITIDNKGDLYIATLGGGIAKLKKGNF